jgi:hypothetical protein
MSNPKQGFDLRAKPEGVRSALFHPEFPVQKGPAAALSGVLLKFLFDFRKKQ